MADVLTVETVSVEVVQVATSTTEVLEILTAPVGQKGDTGRAPVVSMSGDRITVDGVAVGPSLTGPASTEPGPASTVPGPANTLAIGTVASGASPAATITGTSPNQTLNLTLPKGDKGNQGDSYDASDLAALNTTASTGLLTPTTTLTINADPTKFNLGAGAGYVVSTDDPLAPTRVLVTWAAQSAIVDQYIATAGTTYICVNSSGAVVQLTEQPTQSQSRSLILIGWLDHPGRVEIESTLVEPYPVSAAVSQLDDFLLAFGSFNVAGNLYAPAGGLQIQRSAGEIFEMGSNFVNNPTDPHTLATGIESPCVIYYYRRNPSLDSGWESGTEATAIDPDTWDDGTAIGGTVPTGKFTVQTLSYYAPSESNDVQYGQTIYDSMASALSSLKDPVEIDPYNSYDVFRGWLIVAQGATDLTDPDQAMFVAAGKLGMTDVSSGGGTGGEVNTSSDAGSAGVGLTMPKSGVDLPFKTIAAGSDRIAVTDNPADHSVRVDVDQTKLSVGQSQVTNLAATLAGIESRALSYAIAIG